LPVYWGDGYYAGPIGMIPFAPIIDKKTLMNSNDFAQQHHGDPHLRSTNKIKGYHIHANDGEIGHVEDYIVDDEKWNLCSLIVDTHNWLPGRKVLIQPCWINHIDCDESIIYVILSQAAIKNSPVFDPSQPIGKDYERELFNHYKDMEIHVDKTGHV
jgi:sporulation protein YlmC with PRC-barrel domain